MLNLKLKSDVEKAVNEIITCFQLEVKEAKKVETHPQWEISDDDGEKDNDEGSDTEGSSDYDSEDD